MLSKVADTRSRHGLRHELPDVLLMCIMGVMCGYYGYRELGRFMKNHAKEFQQVFQLKHEVPSYVTIRDVLQRIDFKSFGDMFNEWAGQYVDMCRGGGYAIDGKAIGSTTTESQSPYQNFVSLVSVFSCERGIVVCMQKINNKKESEIPTVRRLIEAPDVRGEVFTVDALHCQKKRFPQS